jgi:sulfopyruvate decarboxylase TPP-binding subunit
MSALHANLVVAKLKSLGISHVVGLPDNGSRALFEEIDGEASLALVGVTREGEAFAIAAGLFAAGRRPMVLVQNTGLLESGDAFRGTLFNMEFSVLMLIGYRGYESLNNAPGRVDTAASFLEPTLKAWEIPYRLLEDDSDLGVFDEATAFAETQRRPIAILYPGETI